MLSPHLHPKSCLTCVSIAGRDMGIYIFLFRTFPRQITTCNIPGAAIAIIIQHFLQVLIAVTPVLHNSTSGGEERWDSRQ